MKKPNEKAGSSRAPALAVIAFFLASAAQAGTQVTPPPRPPGSSMVVIQGGLNPDEINRQKRAHKDKVHNKKNLVLDDDGAAGKDKSNQGSKK